MWKVGYFFLSQKNGLFVWATYKHSHPSPPRNYENIPILETALKWTISLQYEMLEQDESLQVFFSPKICSIIRHKIIFCRLCILHSRVGIHESFCRRCIPFSFFWFLPDPKNKGSHHVLHSVINNWFLYRCQFFFFYRVCGIFLRLSMKLVAISGRIGYGASAM